MWEKIRIHFDFDDDDSIDFKEFKEGFILAAYTSAPQIADAAHATFATEIQRWVMILNQEIALSLEGMHSFLTAGDAPS